MITHKWEVLRRSRLRPQWHSMVGRVTFNGLGAATNFANEMNADEAQREHNPSSFKVVAYTGEVV